MRRRRPEPPLPRPAGPGGVEREKVDLVARHEHAPHAGREPELDVGPGAPAAGAGVVGAVAAAPEHGQRGERHGLVEVEVGHRTLRGRR